MVAKDPATSKLAELRRLRKKLETVDRPAIMARRLELFDELHELGVSDVTVAEAWGASAGAVRVARHQRR